MPVKMELLAPLPGTYDFAQAEELLKKRGAADEPGYGWLNLPLADLTELKTFAAQLARFPVLLLVGIGGSSLGVETLLKGLCPRGSQVLIADNIDAYANETLMSQIDPRQTALLVVSKSGRTLETLSNFAFFLQNFYEVLGDDLPNHVFAVTDPQGGALRELVTAKGLQALPLPSSVGGRYSVLSSAGLPLAAAAGIDVDSLIAGAAQARSDLMSGGALARAARLAAATVLDGLKAGRNITVFMPYGRALGALGPWFSQLWGESLGKDGWGPTPQPVLGTVDQHSQLQLYAQGPDDKVYFFLGREDHHPAVLGDTPGWNLPLNQLEGLPLSRAMEYELRGTLASLRKANRPCVSFSVETVNEEAFGQLFFFLEWLTALTGLTAGIDPFNQPGVEAGKNYALAQCGDPKWVSLAPEVQELTCPTWSSEE